MNSFDIIVPAVLLLGTIIGWKKGFVRTVCSFAGFFAGLIVAYMLYSVVGEWLAPSVGGNTSLACLIAFVLIWLAVPIGLSLAGSTVSHVLDKIPVIGKLNSLAGALIGFIKFFLVTTIVVYLLILANTISQEVVESSFCLSFMKAFFESFVEAYRAAA